MSESEWRGGREGRGRGEGEREEGERGGGEGRGERGERRSIPPGRVHFCNNWTPSPDAPTALKCLKDSVMNPSTSPLESAATLACPPGMNTASKSVDFTLKRAKSMSIATKYRS